MRVSAIFEEEVRRIARELFPQGNAFGPVIVEGRERDGVINTGESIHIIEATCLPTKKKARDDLEKSIELKRILSRSYSDHNFRIWLITERDPTPDQTAEADEARKRARCPVTALSISAFQQRLINSKSYLSSRDHYPFGSVRHPGSTLNNKSVDNNDFIPIDLVRSSDKSIISPSSLASEAKVNPNITLILGGFGAGKSMTMRHIFYNMKRAYLSNESYKFPIFLNLRDHIGQDVPSSALFDHGSKVGFSNPEQLVRAWRAGFAHIFLDGFDEIASSRFRSGSVGLRAVRRSAMSLVRNFIDQHPQGQSSLFISGRENYFGSNDEMLQAFGIKGADINILTLSDFTLEQVQTYLKRLGFNEMVPEWLPFRPLLIGYLATRGILGGRSALESLSRAEGWNYLLDQICEREGRQIEDLGGQADQVRHYIDRLATRSRATTSGRGPLSLEDMTELFRQIFPSSPDEAAQQLLLRMAGLTGSADGAMALPGRNDNQESREFVDDDLVDVARAGDVARFISYPYDENLISLFSDRNCTNSMGELGIEVAATKISEISSGQILIALRIATEKECPTLALDILKISQYLKKSISDTQVITIKNGYISDLELTDDVDLTCVVVRECIIGRIEFDCDVSLIKGPVFEDCIIEEVYGSGGSIERSRHLFSSNNEIVSVKQDGIANADRRRQPIPDSVKVLVSSLRKLFLQAGSARKENAFRRGLNDIERVYVDDVLDLISKHGFAFPQRHRGPILWVPNRTKRAEAVSITESPNQIGIGLLDDVRRL